MTGCEGAVDGCDSVRTSVRTKGELSTESASCLASREGETEPRETSGVTVISLFFAFSFALAEAEARRGDRTVASAAFDEVEGVGRSVPVLLASRGKPMPKTKKEML